MIKKIQSIIKNSEVRNRILFTLVVLFIFKLGSTITVPLVDISSVTIADASDVFGLMNILGGGALQQFSIFALGVSPYITASIVIQLLSMGVLPKLEELSKQGAAGRQKINNSTRALTVLLAAVQGYGIIVTMENQYGLTSIDGSSFTAWEYIYIILILVAGTFLLMWIADQISSKGVGNGTSMIIFAGIIMEIPYQIGQAYNNFVGVDSTDGSAIFNGIIQFAVYLLGYIGIILFVMFTEKAERRIPMQHAQTSFQAATKDVSYLPIKLNSAGVIPVIFASSLLTVPPIIMNFASVPQSHPLFRILSLNTEYEGFYWGTLIYIILIFVFTFFYTSLQLDAEKMAENFAKSGSYIPGVRPGKETEKYLRRIIFRITTIGAICLVFIAALPMFLQNVLALPSSIAFGGTGLIVAVGVAAETAKEINGRLASKDYQGFIF